MPFSFEQAAGQAINTGTGMLLSGYNDMRQIQQQRRLNDANFWSHKQMTEYNMQKQLEMWEKTGYVGQVGQMKRAGLNPGLLYGMGGGGGTSTNVATGNTQSGQAPTGGGEILGSIGMGIQAQMAQAQIELAKSQANKNNVEADKLAGVDTEEANARILNLTQDVTNKKAQAVLLGIEKDLGDIKVDIAKRTKEDQITLIVSTAEESVQRVNMLELAYDIDKKTKNDKIKLIQAEAIGQVLENSLTVAKTGLTEQSTKLTKEQTDKTKTEGGILKEFGRQQAASNLALTNAKINESIQGIMLKWKALSQGDKELILKETMQDSNLGQQELNAAIGAIDKILNNFK